MFKEFMLCSLCFILLLFYATKVNGHPDGATPFWYPSSFIYGYINGCAESVEQGQFSFTEEFWPDEVRSICGCVVDSLRHSLEYEKMLDNNSKSQAASIVFATFPICITEERLKKEYQ
tara:strand:- start:47 stop:400 length:354 start_codon:yes stop_codon:yes gene_type:complete